MEIIDVKTPSYEGKIYLGEDVIKERLPALTKGRKCFVVTDDNVYALYAEWFQQCFEGAEIYVLPAGEKNKNFQSLCDILEKMAAAGMRRNSRLFAVGGGVVGDIGGLAAALYMRGISYVQIPTTLLAQIDSSVGGKTAVDVCGIKNLVGAFYQPCEVLVNPAFLNTLPAREIKCGLGEMVKYAALCGEIFDVLSSDIYRLGNLSYLTGFIADCIRYKAKVVGEDEKETGARRCLNLGHTTGHAIESACGLSHGECVLYGLYLETKVAIEKGVCEKDYGEKLLNLVCGSLAVEPRSTLFHHVLEEGLEKALLDKKNTDDGRVQLAVAKSRGEWATLSLEFEEYRQAIIDVVKF
jgi:3-dehydroquinate synthase